MPKGYQLGVSGLAFEITTTARFSGPIKIRFNVPSVTTQPAFNKLRILHNENGKLVDRTTSRDFATKMVWATVTSLSPFVVAELATEPRVLLQGVLSDLRALGGTVTDRGDRQKLDEIIEELRDALDIRNWLDQTHLKPRRGEEVFDEIKDAIEKLGGLMRDRHSIADAVLQDFINCLLEQSRLLAQTAIIDATTAQTNPRRLAEAVGESLAGDEDGAAGRYNQASPSVATRISR